MWIYTSHPVLLLPDLVINFRFDWGTDADYWYEMRIGAFTYLQIVVSLDSTA